MGVSDKVLDILDGDALLEADAIPYRRAVPLQLSLGLSIDAEPVQGPPSRSRGYYGAACCPIYR